MVPCADFRRALESRQLTGGDFYKVTGLPDTDAANRCMESVRRYVP